MTQRIRISHGAGDGPIPPLAGALAAWVLRGGGDVWVVERGGEQGADAPHGSQGWPLWVHLEADASEERLDRLDPDEVEVVGFGPGVDTPDGVARLRSAYPGARVVLGDPELGLPGVDSGAVADLRALPTTTFAGFGDVSGGLFRLLAGRGDRPRPPGAVVREIVYLVESNGLGHVLFDDADLAAYPGWIEAFEAELAHLPWRVTWQGAR